MLFGKALFTVQVGGYTEMFLPQWSPDVKIKIQHPDVNSKMSAPYMYVESRFGSVPWIPTMIEMFNDKWEVRK